jgi:plastocyanin
MKKLSILIFIIAFSGTGCTAMSLQRHTVNQSLSAADYRYQSTLHTLAMVAADPGTLPSYAILSSGTVGITDTGLLTTTSTWLGHPHGLASQALGLTGTHAPQQLWTVSPVADYTQLEAMRAACSWVLSGQDLNTLYGISILRDPEDCLNVEEDSLPGYHLHFGVRKRLESLPHGWLRWGQACEVPLDARYKDHCGDKWVWVMPDGMEGLAGFTLVLQDIATLNVAPQDNSLPANITPPLLVTLWSVQSTTPKPSTVIIAIKRNGKDVVYPKETEVEVGQYVIWQNVDSDGKSVHSATSRAIGLFDTDKIQNGSYSQATIFDDIMYTKAGGYTSEGVKKDSVIIEYTEKDKPDVVVSRIILKRNLYTGLYSQTMMFREDRVIKPNCKPKIEQRIKEQIEKNPSQPVNITYAEWIDWTRPYQAQRTTVKPGTPQTTPVTIPNRLLPVAAVMNSPVFRSIPFSSIPPTTPLKE